jgi:hypothetical protein
MRMVWRPGMDDFVQVEYGRAVRPATGPILLGDYSPYDCPVTGKIIEGRHAHEENLKRQGCRLLEPGESRDYLKRRDEDFDNSMRKILDI